MIVISIHIPKTGGTSFGKHLKSIYKEHYYEDYSWNHKNLVEVSKDNFCLHGHFLATKYDMIQNSVLVTWVRNPVQRLCSHYMFWKRFSFPDNPRWQRFHDEDWSLEQFAFSPEFRNRHAQMFAGKSTNDFQFIGITENYHQSLNTFCEKYGFATSPNHQIHERKNTLRNADGYLIDTGLKKEIEAYHQVDMEIYQLSVGLLHKIQ